MSKNNGGPAFPCDRIPAGDHVVSSDGMTQRDYFAAKAMQGMIAAEHAGAFAPGRWASKAYEMADAMLKAREQ